MSISNGTSLTFTPNQALWLQSLRFHLNPTSTGEYRFSHVHLGDGSGLRNREVFLQDLLTGRTIDEVLEDLTPAGDNSEQGDLDSNTASEMRHYLRGLAQLLHLHASKGVGIPVNHTLQRVTEHRGEVGQIH